MHVSYTVRIREVNLLLTFYMAGKRKDIGSEYLPVTYLIHIVHQLLHVGRSYLCRTLSWLHVYVVNMHSLLQLVYIGVTVHGTAFDGTLSNSLAILFIQNLG